MVKPRILEKIKLIQKKVRTISDTLSLTKNRFVAEKERARFFAKWGRVRLRENFKWSGTNKKFDFTLTQTINGKPIKLRVRDNNVDLTTMKEVFFQRQYNIKRMVYVNSILDIGANMGCSALYFASKYPHARMECIEPISENVDLLNENLRLNHVNADVHDFGIGVKTEPIWVTYKEDEQEATSIHLDGLHKREIQVRPLDSLGKQFDLIKFDIEGAEYELILGGQKTLLQAKCLVGEIHVDLLGPEKTKYVVDWIEKYFDMEVHPIRPGLYTFVAYRKAR